MSLTMKAKSKASSNNFTPLLHVSMLTVELSVLEKIVSYFVESEHVDVTTLSALRLSCKKLRGVADSHKLWGEVPFILKSGKINMPCFTMLKRKCEGTEGVCVETVCKATLTHFALKKARTFPENEGVPYYMIREIATLKVLKHTHIAPILGVHLSMGKLYMLYPFVRYTLQDILMNRPDGSALNRPRPIRRAHAVALLTQLANAISYCHSKGILHRNLKPKHILITLRQGPGSAAADAEANRLSTPTGRKSKSKPAPSDADPVEFDLEGAVLMVTDFALMRGISRPLRPLTGEMISLWYRPPEILMGERAYTEAVDVWSMGCIFAEMLRGAALFVGISQIEQLFQIFSKLGTPSDLSWPGFSRLRYFKEDMFPQWHMGEGNGNCGAAASTSFGFSLAPLVRGASSHDLEVLERCLQCCPEKRSSAQQIKLILQEQVNKQHLSGASGSQDHETELKFRDLQEAIISTGVALSPRITRSYVTSRALVWTQLQDRHCTEDAMATLRRSNLRPFFRAIKASVAYSAAVDYMRRVHHVKDGTKGTTIRSLHLAVAVLDQYLRFVAEAPEGACSVIVDWCSAVFHSNSSAQCNEKYAGDKSFLTVLLVLCMSCIQAASKYEDVTYLDVLEIRSLSEQLVISDEETLVLVGSAAGSSANVSALPAVKITTAVTAPVACVPSDGAAAVEQGPEQWVSPSSRPFYILHGLADVSVEKVLAMEEHLLNALDFSICTASTVMDFLGIYADECFALADLLCPAETAGRFHCPVAAMIQPADWTRPAVTPYTSLGALRPFLDSLLGLMCEVWLADPDNASFPPSAIAAAMVALSLYVYQEVSWALAIDTVGTLPMDTSHHSQTVPPAGGYRLMWFDCILECWTGRTLQRDCMLCLCHNLRATHCDLPLRLFFTIHTQHGAETGVTMTSLLSKINWERLESFVNSLD